MEEKVFLGQTLIWMMLLLGQGCNGCIVKERNALLELKKHVISQSREEGLYFTLPTWTNDTKSDCCKWKGVKCNRTTGRVIGISTGGLLLKDSSLLNLSLLHPFEDVQSIDLSGNEKTKFNQDALIQFSGLFDDVEGYKSLNRLKNLKILDFSFNRFNRSIFPFLNAATSLTSLILRVNDMDGPFHVKELKDLTNLERLDLSRNRFNGSIPIRELSELWKLKALDLSHNSFSGSKLQELKNLTNLEVLGFAQNYIGGPIPVEVFCEMKNLRELDLGGNNFVGQLPPCLGHLNKLRVLDLSSNELRGNIPSSFSGLKSLEYLSLLGNNFTGLFSLNPLTNLTKLKVLKLSSTSDMVLQVETEPPKFQLRVVVLPFCRLEKIPNILVYQKKLRLVDLSNNRISGNIPTWLLENNPELEVLQLQKNAFTTFHMPTIVHKQLQLLDFSANNISGVLLGNIGNMLPDLVHMNGSDNKFQGDLPSSISEMKNISFLDLSHNSFSGEVPGSLFTGCFSLIYLHLSHNKFSGHILPRRTIPTSSLTVLRMDNNLFTGKIGDGGLSLVYLSIIDMSNNLLTGAIPSWISDLPSLLTLLLSNNLLEGTIPPSLLAKPELYFLDLSGNLLSGSLPVNVSSPGISLFLDDNNLTGPIPNTLLEMAYVLDLQNNKLSGGIPHFDNTWDLSILMLRGNNLTGSIPSKLCHLSNIRLLDLSHTKLSGFIPSCLNNISFGLRGESYTMTGYGTGILFQGRSYWEFHKSTFFVEKFELDYPTDLNIEINFVAKHRYDSYSAASRLDGGALDYMNGLDLSSNELSGVVPAELGDLSNLRSLNLSRNFLSSSIPDSFSKLKDIESLDLSYNMLQGSIPHQLTNLTSLAVFNVTYNNLSGIIPRGRQFNTFNEDSYFGNLLLCGSPTNKSCEAQKNTEEADNEEGEDGNGDVVDMLFFYWSTASTCVTVLIGILVLMCFDCQWRRAWLHFVDGFITSVKNILS